MAGEASTFKGTTYPRGFSRDIDWKWPMVPARELVTLNYGRALKADTRSPGIVPVFGTNGRCGWHDAPLAKAPGLILGRKGQGPLGVEWCDRDFWVIDTAYYASTLTPNLDLKYLYHLVKYVGLNHLKDGTSNPTLSRDTFGAQLFPLPPLPEQKAIASALGALDDKIELNQRMNVTLESMARALFQSWFVDFDPVHANLDGHKSSQLDTAITKLFPASFQDSSIGPIPVGWSVKSLGEIAEFDKGLSYKGEGLAEEGGMPMVNLGCFTGRGLFNANRVKRYTGEYRERHLIRAGDLVVANTDMTQNRVIIGSPALVPEMSGAREFLFTHHVFAVRFKPGSEIWRRYVFFTLLKPEFREIAEGFSTGTTVLALPRDGLFNYSLCFPPIPLLEAFESQVGPLLAAVDANLHQSRALTDLRDTLLPKLLSGELSASSIRLEG